MSDATLPIAARALVRPPTEPIRFAPMVSASIFSAPSLLVALTLVVGLVATGSSLLVDPDTQWHIAVGRGIWAAGAVPHSDLYSHTFAGTPWIAKEWVSQLILFAADAAGGWRGVVLVTALAVGAAFAMLHEHLARRVGPALALAITLVALVLAMPHVLARPHMLVLPVAVAWVAALVCAAERGRTPPAAAVPLMTLWANMHGSFPLGLALAGLLSLEAIAKAPRLARRAQLGRWVLFLAAAGAATLVSPYGIDAILVPLRLQGNPATLGFIAEWNPLGLDAIGCAAIAALALALAALAPDWRRNLVRIVAVAALGAMMVRHVRFISLFGVLAPLLIADALRRWPRLAAVPAKTPAALWGAAAALAAAVPVALAMTAPAPAAAVAPEAAYAAARAAGVEGHVYNDYDFGGFLIAHGVATFVDGRTDQLFLGNFLPRLSQALRDRTDGGFAALLARYEVGWAIVRTGANASRHLAALPGWRQIHRDDVASVFVHDR